MKKILLAFCLALFALNLNAQKDITVNSKNYTIEEIDREGLSVVIELDKKTVKDKWKKFIKEYGKVENKKNSFIVPSAEIPSVSSTPVKLYSVVDASGDGTMVWIAIDMGDKYVVEGESEYNDAKRLLEDFAKKCYKEDIQEQVDDAQKAYNTAENNKEKVDKEGDNLESDLEDNAQEKIDLEKKLEENADEKVQLEKDIEQNKSDKEAAEKELEKMKKALEIKKAELAKYE